MNASLSNYVFRCHGDYLQIEEEEPTGYIRFEKFLPMMTRVLMERRSGDKLRFSFVSFSGKL